MSLMKTVRYTIDRYDGVTRQIEVIQRKGGLVTINGDENPYAGEDFVDNLINSLEDGKQGIRNIDVYFTDYKTGKHVCITEDELPSI